MNKILLITSAILMLSMSSFAQNDIQFNIHHKLGNTDFAMETEAKNNLEHDFEVTRLEYYISEISITHDNDTETVIEDVWILVNAGETTQVDLGNYNINTVEKISFHIGVDPDHNHLDPSTYHASHPLAPRSPSMHWGWAPGYRFIAFEGNGSSNFNQLLELHGLGDENYFKTELALNITADNNAIVINLDADYERALEGINLNEGIIVHGDYGAAKQCVENFRDFVFSPTAVTTATIDFSEVNNFSVYPNPTNNGDITMALTSSDELNYQVSITDVLGRQIQFYDNVNSNTTTKIQLNERGLYFVNLIKEGQIILSRKLISK